MAAHVRKPAGAAVKHVDKLPHSMFVARSTDRQYNDAKVWSSSNCRAVCFVFVKALHEGNHVALREDIIRMVTFH